MPQVGGAHHFLDVHRQPRSCHLVALLAIAGAALARNLRSQPTSRAAPATVVENGDVERSAVLAVINPVPQLVLASELMRSSNPFASAKQLPDGRVVVVDFTRALLFEKTGAFVRAIPETASVDSQIRDVCVGKSDTIALVGYTHHQLTVFTLAGQPVRVVRLEGIVGADACFADGSVLLRRASSSNLKTPDAPATPSAETLLRLSNTGIVRDSTATEIAHTFDHATPFVNNVVPGRDRLFIADRRVPEYRVISNSGGSLQTVRWKQSSHLPALGRLKVDPRGRVWIELARDANRDPLWAVFDTSGHLIGRVPLPHVNGAQTKLVGVDSSYATLVSRGHEGRVTISIHPLRFPE